MIGKECKFWLMSRNNDLNEQFDLTLRPIQSEWGDSFYCVLAFVRSGRIVAGQQSMLGQEVHRGILQWMKFLCCFYQLLSYAIVIEKQGEK